MYGRMEECKDIWIDEVMYFSCVNSFFFSILVLVIQIDCVLVIFLQELM